MIAGPWRTQPFWEASPAHPEQCQDAVAVFATRSGDPVLCVCDGAGSSREAYAAAQKLIEIAGIEIATMPLVANDADGLDEWLRRLMSRCGRAFDSWITTLEANVDDYSTTFTFVLLSDSWVGIGSIGDGFVAAHDAGLGSLLLIPPDRPSGVSSSAAYMMADWASHARYRRCWLPCVDSVMLSTDGLEKFLVFRQVQGVDGNKRQELWGVQDLIESVLLTMPTSRELLDSLTPLSDAKVRTAKGDDIGVAVASRRFD